MSQPKLTVATPDDVPRLLPLMEEFNRLEEIEVDAEQHHLALLTLLRGPELGRVYLFEADGALAGYAVLTFNYDLEFAGRDAFLTELFVVPAARGKGIARSMLAALERAAIELDVKALHLMVRPENTIAQRLYAKSGYSPAQRITLGKVLGSVG